MKGCIIWESGNWRVGQHPHLRVYHVQKHKNGEWITCKEVIGSIEKVKDYLREVMNK